MKLIKTLIFCIVLMLVSIMTNSSKAFLNKAIKLNIKLGNREGALKVNSNKNEGSAIGNTSSTTKANTGIATETDSEDCGCDDD